jgi:predicted DNA-binding antitoxin AbrB/MazE fold protein
MQHYRLKAKYEGQAFKPEHALDLPEGTEVTLLVIPSFRSFLGILEEVKEDSVNLQHKVKDLWSADAD